MLHTVAVLVALAWVPLQRVPYANAGRSLSQTGPRAAAAPAPAPAGRAGRLLCQTGLHATAAPTKASIDAEPAAPPLRVMVAGGGIGGLCAALVLKNQGFQVRVDGCSPASAALTIPSARIRSMSLRRPLNTSHLVAPSRLQAMPWSLCCASTAACTSRSWHSRR